MDIKLSEIIKEIEDAGGIVIYYLHNNYYSGKSELNIEFKNDIADKVLEKAKLATIPAVASWKWGKEK